MDPKPLSGAIDVLHAGQRNRASASAVIELEKDRKRTAEANEGAHAKRAKDEEGNHTASAPEQERPSGAQAAQGDGYVGWVDTEIVGHSYHCDNQGKYRRHADKGFYCCANARDSARTVLALRRNPHNAYDANAVEVHGSRGCMLGHLPRELAASLAPLLDLRAPSVVWLRGDGFEVGRGSPGDFFTLLVHADEAWFAGRPEGDALAARWAKVKRCLQTKVPPEGEGGGGCFRFPRD